MTIRQRLRSGPPLLLDGPTGTELERRGVDTSSPVWSTMAVRTHPDTVRAVHADYVAAGAEVHTAVTFRADRAAFDRAGLDEAAWHDMGRAAVRLAREAVGQGGGFVAGALAPLGDCYAPEEVPDDATLRGSHAAQAHLMAEAGVDVVLVETMNTVREAVVATEAVVAKGLPVMTSFVVVPGKRLLSGEPLGRAVEAVVDAGADAVLVNCSSLGATGEAMGVLEGTGAVWGAYANGSSADPRKGWTAGMDVADEVFVEAARAWLDAGARVIGSCCGTTPTTTRALRRMLDERALRRATR